VSARKRRRVLAGIGFCAALLFAAFWILVNAPTRVDYLVRVVRAHESDQAAMDALVELLGVYEKRGRLAWVTIDNFPERLGLRQADVHEVARIPLPFFEEEPSYRGLKADFPQVRKRLLLNFDRESGCLAEWCVEAMATEGGRTLY